MKRQFLLAGSLAFYMLLAKAQERVKKEEAINQTEIEMLYNHYLQDGDNSAITGGEGTERLTVYGPSFAINRSFGKNALSFQLGSDVISSASTDNIDSMNSSASRLDARTYTDLGYSRLFLNGRLQLNAGVNFSIESDYFSFGKYLGANLSSKDKIRSYSASLQLYNDDLRWGRLDDGFLEAPLFLIYPEELRFIEWYDVYKRNTFTLNLGYSQVINKRNTIGVYGLLTLQEGLLATPFHRVFFEDETRAVEQLPQERTKGALTLKWNTFLGGRTVLKSGINAYADTFGIVGFAFENETAFKINSKWTLLPSARWYFQEESKYFAFKGEHSTDQEFYTSDFDLSKFNSLSLGLEIKHSPLGAKQHVNRDFRWRYQYYGRSNSLTGHSLSFVMTIRNFKKRK